ncbi:MAG: hypothetical protein V1847_03185 [Candidatus Diapherotrites archaeon]
MAFGFGLFGKARGKTGFIGPIGDDLPSLIPLVFALVVFFAAFQSALSTFDSKNASFADDLDALKVARILRGSGYWVSQPEFAKACDIVNVRAIRFEAGITELNVRLFDSYGNISNRRELYLPHDLETDAQYFCSNVKDLKDISLSELQKEGKVLIRIYPIVIEVNRPHNLGIIVKPVQLVVISWR